MQQTLFYSPGQTVTIFLETLDSNGVRADGYADASFDGYDYPVVTRLIYPNLTLATGYPAYMTRLDTGLYYYQFVLPTGASSVGSYLVDIEYVHPTTLYINTAMYQVSVNAPYGNYGGTITI